MYCTSCGTFNEQSAKFCYHCGNALIDSNIASISTIIPKDYKDTEHRISNKSKKMSFKAKFIWSVIALFCGIVLFPFFGWLTLPAALFGTLFALSNFWKEG